MNLRPIFAFFTIFAATYSQAQPHQGFDLKDGDRVVIYGDSITEQRLKSGETKHETLTLDARAFSYWDVSANSWRIDPGIFQIFVGDSSEHTPLKADVHIIRNGPNVE